MLLFLGSIRILGGVGSAVSGGQFCNSESTVYGSVSGGIIFGLKVRYRGNTLEYEKFRRHWGWPCKYECTNQHHAISAPACFIGS